MSVTPIISLQNDTNYRFWVVNWENIADTFDVKGEIGLSLGARQNRSRTMWIPWAWDEDTFLHGSSSFLHGSAPSHITVYRDAHGQAPVFSIFQHNELIQVIPGEKWAPSAFTVIGESGAGGDRNFYIETAAAVGDDLLPFWPALYPISAGHVGPPGG